VKRLPEGQRRLRERFEESWALWSILAAQATLTLPWMWRTAAYNDEALYLNAAHQGWAHLPSYANSFPGLPVLYPPIASAFDSIGGLIAARLVSLVFMLGATAMVYLIGDRLFGRICGVLAALLFAVCGIVVHLGAAATFDPMALFLLVLALYAAVRMRDGGVRWLLICPIALAAANATKYPTLAWDPVIVATVILYGWSKGRFQAVVLAASVTATTAVLDLGILMLGGANVATGVLRSTIYPSAQAGLPSSSLSVLEHALLMTGLIVLIAIGGVWASVVKKMPATATLFQVLLVLAALLAPIEQARVHQLTSLDENMSFGLPFAALGAGYALGAWRQWLGRQRHWGKVIATIAAVITVITMLIVGRVERVQFRGPGSVAAQTVALAIAQNYTRGTFVLVDGSPRTDQYNVPSVPPQSWLTSSDPAFQTILHICNGQVSVIVLHATGPGDPSPADQRIPAPARSMFLRVAIAGSGDHTTEVWALKHGTQSCKNAG
jgi:4-amino-4-deoxy-L-arabinose transferase-like glycosyltransferase